MQKCSDRQQFIYIGRIKIAVLLDKSWFLLSILIIGLGFRYLVHLIPKFDFHYVNSIHLVDETLELKWIITRIQSQSNYEFTYSVFDGQIAILFH
jgi:hypothetical protein